jgi:hypothetical protein
MSKRRLIILGLTIAVIALLVGFILLLGNYDQQPTYAGKTLREWLLLHVEDIQNRDSPETGQAATSIKHIGSNAVPFLIRWLEDYQEMPKWRSSVYGGVENALGSQVAIRVASALEPHYVNSLLAREAFRVLGPAAECAIPNLIRLATNSTTPPIASRATSALGDVGEASLPHLIQILDNPNSTTRIEALVGLGRIGTNAHNAVPTVLNLLADGNATVRLMATNCLKRIAPHVLTNASFRYKS